MQNLYQQENKKAKEVKSIVIMIDGITSGKMENGVFSFTYRKKLIDNPLFPLLPKNEYYGYQHHFDNGVLERAHKVFPELFPYDFITKEGYEQYKNITVTSWGDVIKHNLYKLIADGKFNKTVEKEEYIVEVKVEWKGEPIPEPTLVEKKKKSNVEKKDKAEEALLAGLQLF